MSAKRCPTCQRGGDVEMRLRQVEELLRAAKEEQARLLGMIGVTEVATEVELPGARAFDDGDGEWTVQVKGQYWTTRLAGATREAAFAELLRLARAS